MASPTIVEMSDLLNLHGLQVVEQDGRKFLHCFFALDERTENALLTDTEAALTHFRLPGRLFEVLPVPLPDPVAIESVKPVPSPVVIVQTHEIPVAHLVQPDAIVPSEAVASSSALVEVAPEAAPLPETQPAGAALSEAIPASPDLSTSEAVPVIALSDPAALGIPEVIPAAAPSDPSSSVSLSDPSAPSLPVEQPAVAADQSVASLPIDEEASEQEGASPEELEQGAQG